MKKPANYIWIFVGTNTSFPSGIFTSKELAIEWVKKHNLTGTLSLMPLDEGVFDWSVRNDMLTIKKEKIPEKSKDPHFIASCFPASLEHYHFENGSVA